MKLTAQRALFVGGQPIRKGQSFEVTQPYAAGLVERGDATIAPPPISPAPKTKAKKTAKPSK